MTETKFTKGPWFLHRDELLHERHPHGSYTLVGNFTQDETGNNCSVDEANAYLISAAPELYDALEGMADAYEIGERTETPELDLALAALAKARGET